MIVNANDISVMGGLPKYMTLTLLLPPSDDYVEVLQKIMNQGMQLIFSFVFN